MRALLVVNPKATTTSERSRDVLVRALRSEAEKVPGAILERLGMGLDELQDDTHPNHPHRAVGHARVRTAR